MNRFLDSIFKRYPIPVNEEWVTTVNLSKIKTSNESFNKIPDDCEVILDIRYVPEEADIIVNNIKALLTNDFKMDIIEYEPAVFIDESNPYLQLLQKTAEKVTNKKVVFYGAQGTSDARHFTRVGINGVEFGPIGEGIGGDSECVNIKSLEQYYQTLKDFLYDI